MSIEIAQSTTSFAALKPFIHGLAYAELLGNKNATCAIFSIDGSIEGGKSTALKIPSDGYIIVLEGEMRLEDVAKPGETVKLSKGDVVSVANGANVRAGSPNECKGFAVALKAFGDRTWEKDAV